MTVQHEAKKQGNRETCLGRRDSYKREFEIQAKIGCETIKT